MNLKIILTIPLIALSLCACEEQKSISPDLSSLSASEKSEATWAFDALKAHCQSLFTNYKNDIEKIEADITKIDNGWCEHDYLCAEYGWKNQIWLRVKLKNSTTRIPVSFRAQGHTLHYILSTTGVAAILSKKPQSQLVCDWQPNLDGSDALVKL